MSTSDNSSMGWIIGAMVVIGGVAAYLWMTAPEDSVLSETYTVM